jgi:hypothetical protein
LVELHLNRSAKMKKQLFCLPWQINIDEWWTHHPGFRESFEHNNDTHYCFEAMPNRRTRFFRELYNIQYKRNCSNVFTKKMWQAGWGADFAHIVDGLLYAMNNVVPMQVSNDRPWHYAAKKDGSRPACPSKDMYCYFLNMTNCKPNNRKAFGKAGKRGQFMFRNSYGDEEQPPLDFLYHSWLVEYASRPQTWLRKAVYDFSKTIQLTSPCIVMHVRRGDVILHGKQSRRYFAMEEYMNATFDWNTAAAANDKDNDNTNTKTIFLLTDDDNAIQEARSKFPSYHWVYIDRPRFKGAQGGFENQIPSDDPQWEVIVLLSIFHKVKQCRALVHTQSSLAELVAGIMLDARDNTNKEGARDRDPPLIFRKIDKKRAK